MTREHLAAFGQTLTHDDHVVIEATGNAAAVTEVLAPHVERVVIANPRQVQLIAKARIKTDVIDATVLAKLYASNFLPEAWAPDIAWHLLRRCEDYAWVRLALHAKKLRDLELRSGQPARRGQRGTAYAYNLARTRFEEKRRAQQAEAAYRRQTAGWTRRGPKCP